MTRSKFSVLLAVALLAASSIALAEPSTISRNLDTADNNPDTADNNIDTLSARANESWNFYSSWYSPEKLFLHLDRTYYAIGETIWFTGYLTNALPNCHKELSNYIYVELLNDKGVCIQREKVKVQDSSHNSKKSGAETSDTMFLGSQKNGGDSMGTGVLKKADTFKIFPGQIEISDALSSGVYSIRAYAKWQLNGQADILFTQKIRIKGDKQLLNKPLPVEKVEVDFYPESGRYFAGEKSVIGFKATDAHGRNVEISGRLVCVPGDGYQGSVAGASGAANSQEIQVSTAHDGMGIINFTPEAGCKYFLELQGTASESSALAGRFELPEPASEGAAIRVNNLSNAVYVSVQTKGLSEGCCLYLRSASGMRALKIIGFNVAGESASAPGAPVAAVVAGSFAVGARVISEQVVLPAKGLESGINHLIVADRSGKVLAERLFFIYRRVAQQFTGNFSTEKQQYGKRDRIRTNFSLRDAQGRPVTGQFSVSVVRGAFEGFMQESDITSYMAIESELPGPIHDPQYYFSESVPLKERRSNLDLLLMVQGWRYYDMEKILGCAAAEGGAREVGAGSAGVASGAGDVAGAGDAGVAGAAGAGGASVSGVEKVMNDYFGLKYGRELTQSISGKVTGSFGKKKTKEYDLNVLIPSQNAVRSVRVDGGNTFFVDSLDFQDNTSFIVSSIKSKGVGVYRPTWDGEVFAPIAKFKRLEGSVVDLAGKKVLGTGNLSAGVGKETNATANGSAANLEIKANSYTGDVAEDFIIDSLADVVVSARVEPELYTDQHSPLEVRIANQKDSWDFKPFIDFLLAMERVFFYNYNNSTMYNGTTGFVNNGGGGFLPVGLVINGISQMDWSQLEFVLCQDVQIQSVSKEMSLLMHNAGGGLVAVKAFQGREFSKEMDPSTIYFVPLGYQEPQKFYSPRYDLGGDLQTKESDGSADRRNTIYWSPMVKMGQGGARINFCNSDLVDWPYVIHIEGVTDSGVPFSWRGLLDGSK